MDACPTPDALRQLLDDTRCGAERSAVERHVERCPRCQQMLEQLTADSLVDRARAWRSEEEPGPGGLLGLRRAGADPISRTGALDGVTVAADADPPPVAPPGYEILDELGRGGMGVVFKARQVQLGRVVALKTIRAGELASVAERARFRTEAETIASIQHPHIIHVHEILESAGRLWLSLEFCGGGSLAAKLVTGPLEPLSAALLVETLARAVGVAHASGVVHRDLKPANVLFTTDAMAKIADFGLARRLDGSGMTREGAVLGTPSYMAPEQATGDPTAIGPRTDVYALGAILYECLTGRPPFRAATGTDTIRQVIHIDPLPPRRLQPRTPRDLDTICLKCLEKSPARRYATAAALAEDLGRFRAGLPILARPLSLAGRTARLAARNPGMATLFTLLVASILGGLGLVAWQWRRAETEWARAEDKAVAEGVAKANADAARRDAEQRQMLLAAARGRELCEEGEIEQGLLWLARAVELAERSGSSVIDRPLRLSLTAWSAQVPRMAWVATHQAGCNKVAFRPDGGLVASAGNDCQVRLWEAPGGAAAGAPLWVYFPPLHTRVWDVAFSPDGSRLLTGGADGSGLLWDVATRRRLHVLRHAPDDGHANVWDVAFSPDGTLAATCGPGDAIMFWDTATGLPAGEPIPHDSNVRALAFSPDGRTLLSACFDGKEVRRWDVATRAAILPPLRQTDLVQSIRFSPDGRWLLTGSYEGYVNLWNMAALAGERLPFQSGQVTDVAFDGAGSIFATAAGGLVRLWDAWNRQQVGPILRHDSDVASIAFSPDARALAVGERSGAVRLWTLPGIPSPPPLASVSRVVGMGLDAAGERLLVAWPGAWAIHDATHPDMPEVLRREWQASGREGLMERVAISRDGATVAAGGNEGSVVVWDAAGEARGLLPKLNGEVTELAFDATGERLFAAGNPRDGFSLFPRDRVRMWATRTGESGGPLLADLGAAVADAVWLPGGRQMLLGCADRTARLVDVDSGGLAGEALRHSSAVTSVAVSPDGSVLVTGCRDGTVRVWNGATRAPRGRPLRLSREVTALATSRDGTLVAAADLDGVARVWDIASGEPVGMPMRHVGAIRFVVFHPAARHLFTGGQDGHVRRWEIPAVPMDGPALEVRARIEELTGLALDESDTIQPRTAR